MTNNITAGGFARFMYGLEHANTTYGINASIDARDGLTRDELSQLWTALEEQSWRTLGSAIHYDNAMDFTNNLWVNFDAVDTNGDGSLSGQEVFNEIGTLNVFNDDVTFSDGLDSPREISILEQAIVTREARDYEARDYLRSFMFAGENNYERSTEEALADGILTGDEMFNIVGELGAPPPPQQDLGAQHAAAVGKVIQTLGNVDGVDSRDGLDSGELTTLEDRLKSLGQEHHAAGNTSVAQNYSMAAARVGLFNNRFSEFDTTSANGSSGPDGLLSGNEFFAGIDSLFNPPLVPVHRQQVTFADGLIVDIGDGPLQAPTEMDAMVSAVTRNNPLSADQDLMRFWQSFMSGNGSRVGANNDEDRFRLSGNEFFAFMGQENADRQAAA